MTQIPAEAPATPMPVTLPEAYRVCADIVRRHDENFPVVSRFIAAPLRPALAAVYAFARLADDIADAAAPSDERLAGLDRIEAALLEALDGGPEGPVLTALADAVEQQRLPVEPFLDLLGAFRMDARDATFETWDDLLGYCRGSANTIGRLVLALHSIDDPTTLEESDAVCTALQLTNLWQDLARDLERGRVFLPRADMARFGLEAGVLRDPKRQDALTGLLREECRATEGLYARGEAIPARVPRGLGIQLRVTIAGGRAVLRRVEERGWRVLVDRPSLGQADRWKLLVKGVFA
ncbi:MAG TPA: squalene synthase HpnC [Candidatus Eisenbacteria bacterium]|nr:squalene synthase HpnC [Candidatus Eisenbacteria bacterium]